MSIKNIIFGLSIKEMKDLKKILDHTLDMYKFNREKNFANNALKQLSKKC